MRTWGSLCIAVLVFAAGAWLLARGTGCEGSPGRLPLSHRAHAALRPSEVDAARATPTGPASAGRQTGDPDLTAAAQAFEALKAGGRDSLRWLVQFSVQFASDPRYADQAALALKNGRFTRRFRWVLLVLLGVAGGDIGTDLLRDIALSDDDALAWAGARALLFRANHVTPTTPRERWFEDLWTPVAGQLGGAVNPAIAMQRPQGESSGFGTSLDLKQREQVSTPWSPQPLSPGDESATRHALGTILRMGHSSLARVLVLEQLPSDARTDAILGPIVEAHQGSELLRTLAYEHFSNDPANWPYFENGLKTETDPRTLASVIVTAFFIAPADSRLTAVRLAEQVASIAAGDQQLAERLTASLSGSETEEGLNALVRLARTGQSDTLRSLAVQSIISQCGLGSRVMGARITSVPGLLQDADPVVSASAAEALLTATTWPPTASAARAAMDAPTMERIRSLAADPHVPDSHRATLKSLLSEPLTPPKILNGNR